MSASNDNDTSNSNSNESSAATDSNDANNSNSISNSNSIRLVIQRYRKASLLIDEKEVVTVGAVTTSTGSSLLGSASDNINININSNINSNNNRNTNTNTNTNTSHIGMLVYVSFSKRARPQEVQKAARTILNLPIQTEGAWGDGSSTKSIVQVAVDAAHRIRIPPNQKHIDNHSDNNNCNDSTPPPIPIPANVSILLVPQANLIAKVKKNGKSVQYRDQIDKTSGEALYHLLVECIEGLLVEEQQQQQQQSQRNHQSQRDTGGTGTPQKNQTSKRSGTILQTKKGGVDPSVPPKEFFQCLQEQAQQEDGSTMLQLYGSLDPFTGLPLTAADGSPLTKSASKRIRKLYEVHAKKHEKYLSKQQKKQQQQQQQHTQQDDSKESPHSAPSEQPPSASASDTDPISEESSDRSKDTTPTTIITTTIHNAPKEKAVDHIQRRKRLDPSFVKLVAGSFGKRQGLELVSDMGPFCHVIDL